MTIPTFSIENVDNVKTFFVWLADNALLTHPDDDFEIFIEVANEVGDDEIDEPCMTYDEARVLNGIMDKCFEVCDEQGADIYEIAEHVYD